MIPNERLAAGILRNDTLGSDAIGLDVSVWLPPDADTGRALDGAGRGDRQPSIAEVTHEGVRIKVVGDPVPPPRHGPRQAELRAECLQAPARRGPAGRESRLVGESGRATLDGSRSYGRAHAA